MGAHAMQIPGMGLFRLSPFRLIWRSITVVIVTVSSCASPSASQMCMAHLECVSQCISKLYGACIMHLKSLWCRPFMHNIN